MTFSAPSFAKINIGLRIGVSRADGYHELRTVYQTIALHDIVKVQLRRGRGIEILCSHPRVPTDESNTCYRIVERAADALGVKAGVVIEIDKRLPVQGGLGAGSANAASALLLLQRALKKKLPQDENLRITAEIGSDVPLFLIGGTVLGTGHGDEVYPLADIPPLACVIALPDIAVSTPEAFQEWDRLLERQQNECTLPPDTAGLTRENCSDRLGEFSRSVSAWLDARSGLSPGRALSGVPGAKHGGRAEILLLDLVRTGIENDFERVVFTLYPELREVKRTLEMAGAVYASLSGSGSAVYGLFASRAQAVGAASKLKKAGIAAVATQTLTRPQYWKRLLATGS